MGRRNLLTPVFNGSRDAQIVPDEAPDDSPHDATADAACEEVDRNPGGDSHRGPMGSAAALQRPPQFFGPSQRQAESLNSGENILFHAA